MIVAVLPVAGAFGLGVLGMHIRGDLSATGLLWVFGGVAVLGLAIATVIIDAQHRQFQAVARAFPRTVRLIVGPIGMAPADPPVNHRRIRSLKDLPPLYVLVVSQAQVDLRILSTLALVTRLRREGLSVRERFETFGPVHDRRTIELTNHGDRIHVAVQASPPGRFGQRAALRSHDLALRALGRISPDLKISSPS